MIRKKGCTRLNKKSTIEQSRLKSQGISMLRSSKKSRNSVVFVQHLKIQPSCRFNSLALFWIPSSCTFYRGIFICSISSKSSSLLLSVSHEGCLHSFHLTWSKFKGTLIINIIHEVVYRIFAFVVGT